MSQLGGRIPWSSVDGAQQYNGGQSGWKQLRDLFTIPPDVTGAVLSAPPSVANNVLRFALSPDSVGGGGIAGLEAPGGILTLHQAEDIQQCCIQCTGLAQLVIQFFTGPQGELPDIVQAGGGGGGPVPPGGVTQVTATDPLQSTGGATPDIQIKTGTPLDVLVQGATGWELVTSATNKVIHVSQEQGDDSFHPTVIGSPLYPFSTLYAAEQVARGGDVIHLHVGTYYSYGDCVDLVEYYLDPGAVITGTIADGSTMKRAIFSGFGLINANAINTSNAASELYIDLPRVVTGANFSFNTSLWSVGTLIIHADVIVLNNPGIGCSMGLLEIHGDVDCVQDGIALGYDGILNILGRVTSRNQLLYSEWNSSDCTVNIYGPVAGADINIDSTHTRVTLHEDVDISSANIVNGTLEVRSRFTGIAFVDAGGTIVATATARFVAQSNPVMNGTGTVKTWNAWFTFPISPPLLITGIQQSNPSLD